jgi:hypothetical protein
LTAGIGAGTDTEEKTVMGRAAAARRAVARH